MTLDIDKCQDIETLREECKRLQNVEEKAFLAGFLISREGFNSEYLEDEDTGTPYCEASKDEIWPIIKSYFDDYKGDQ